MLICHGVSLPPRRRPHHRVLDGNPALQGKPSCVQPISVYQRSVLFEQLPSCCHYKGRIAFFVLCWGFRRPTPKRRGVYFVADLSDTERGPNGKRRRNRQLISKHCTCAQAIATGEQEAKKLCAANGSQHQQRRHILSEVGHRAASTQILVTCCCFTPS